MDSACAHAPRPRASVCPRVPACTVHRTCCMYSHRCTSPMIVPIIVPAGCWAVIEVTVQQICFESNSLPQSFTTAVKNVGSVALMLPHFGETHSRPVSERVPRPHCCARFMICHFWPGVSVRDTQVRPSDAVRKSQTVGMQDLDGRGGVIVSHKNAPPAFPTRASPRETPCMRNKGSFEPRTYGLKSLMEKNLLCLDT